MNKEKNIGSVELVSKKETEVVNPALSSNISSTKENIVATVSSKGDSKNQYDQDFENEKRRINITSTAEKIYRNKIKLNLESTLKLLEAFETLEKKPQYKLNSVRVYNEEKGEVETFFYLSSLDEMSGDYSKFNIKNVVNFEDFIDIKKDGESFKIVFNYVNLDINNLKLLKRQLYYNIYIKLIKKGVKSGFGDFDRIINKYIDGFAYYNNKENQDKFEAIVAGPDLFEKDIVNEKTGEIEQEGNIENIYFLAWFNSSFIKKISPYFGEYVSEFNELKEFDEFQNSYHEIINQYKNKFDDFYKDKISLLLKNKKKYLFILKKIEDGDESVEKILEEKPDLKDQILSELEKIDLFFNYRDEIDILIDSKGISEFKKRVMSLHREIRKSLDEQRRSVSMANSKSFLNEIQEKIYEETSQMRKVSDYCSNYENFNLNQKKSFSKNVEKGDVVFEINFKDNLKFFGTDGIEDKKRIFKFISRFNIAGSKDFDFQIKSNSLKIVSKKSGILIDSFRDGKLLLTVDSKLYENYKISGSEGPENFEEPFEIERYEFISFNDKDFEGQNSHFEKIESQNLGLEEGDLFKLMNSGVGSLEYLDYDYPQIFISENARIDHLKGLGVFGKNLNIYSINQYPEGINQDKVIKPAIFGENIFIQNLENNDQIINLISNDYIKLSLLENSGKLDSKGKDIEKNRLFFDYSPNSDSFLSPSSLLKKVELKINNFQTNIEGYENRKKRFVNTYVDVISYLHGDEEKIKIYEKMDKKLVYEINKVKDLKLVHDLNSIKEFLKKEVFNLSDEEISSVGELGFNKLRKLFYSICEIYFDSNENKKNIKISNFYKKSLENIENLNTSQEINIGYNSADGVLLKIDNHNLRNLRIEGNRKKIKDGIFLEIPKGIGIKIKIKNGILYVDIEKTLEDLIKEKLKLIDEKYFTSFTGIKTKALSPDDKAKVTSYISNTKEELVKEIVGQITIAKDIRRIENSKNVNIIFLKTTLDKIRKKTEHFEKENRIGKFFK